MAALKINVEKMTEEQAKEWLEKIVNKLDELDLEDRFGAEALAPLLRAGRLDATNFPSLPLLKEKD